MKNLLRELAGYMTSSVCALVVDVSLLWILVQYFSFRYLTAAMLSFLCGATVAYALSIRIAFKEHRINDRRIEFLIFIALGTVGLGVNAAVISTSVYYLGAHYLIAKCFAAACTFGCNFLLRRHFLFVRPTYVPEKRCAP